MHKYVEGHWAASTYAVGGSRTDHVLFFSPGGSFRWLNEWPSEAGRRHKEHVGSWAHDHEQDVLTLTSTEATGETVNERWSIHYVSGCEGANTILVLRRLVIASRNLPILFQRIHPPGDPVWHAQV